MSVDFTEDQRSQILSLRVSDWSLIGLARKDSKDSQGVREVNRRRDVGATVTESL